MTTVAIQTAVIEVLNEVTQQEFKIDDSLTDRFDSLQALEVLVGIEQRLGVEVLDDDLFEKGAWDSVQNLVAYFEGLGE